MSDHYAVWEPHPTPHGGLGEFFCLGCGFMSVLITEREGVMYIQMHENGLAGLPGTRMEAAR